MYHQYTTPAIVLKQIPVGESSTRLHLLTRDYGLLSARAQGLRRVESKLRQSLAEWSVADISLITGAHGLRVIGAVFLFSIFDELKGDSKKIEMLSRISLLARRVVPDEADDTSAYHLFDGLRGFLSSVPLSEQATRNLEHIAALRILATTGYLKGGRDLKNLAIFTKGNEWNLPLISKMDMHRREAVVEINRAIKASQL